MEVLETPSLWILIALAAYAFTYYVYSRWVDIKIWRSSPERTTPAHMYMDGVEYFPVDKKVLWGFQFKNIAALGPILGPFIAIAYGWLPALLWIILGNMFIGWVQDYSSIMVSIRNEGKSIGPLVHQYVGRKPRVILIGYLLFYLLIMSAVLIYLISTLWNIFPGTFMATVAIIFSSLFIGALLYKIQADIHVTTILSIVLVIVSILIGICLPYPPKDFLGTLTPLFWMIILGIIIYVGSIAPMSTFITPLNFVSTFPAIAGMIILIIGALLSPILGISLKQPSFITAWDPTIGPIFPILFVSIACGAVSGWHSLVSTSTTAKQLDLETDARPVGVGAMLTEGLLALSALAAYMVLAPNEIKALSEDGPTAFVFGATKITTSYLGGEAALTFWRSFFALFLVIYAITVQVLVTRFWRIFSSEFFTGSLGFLGNRHVATFIGIFIPILFALSGSWINLWIYFGGSNQLLAGLVLMLVVIVLVKSKKPSYYALGPAIFMIIITISALTWETYTYIDNIVRYVKTGDVTILSAMSILIGIPMFALAMNIVLVIVGLILIGLGIIMSYYLFKSFTRVGRGSKQ